MYSPEEDVDTDQKKRAIFDHLRRATGEGPFGLFQKGISKTVSFVVSFSCLIRSCGKNDWEEGNGRRRCLVGPGQLLGTGGCFGWNAGLVGWTLPAYDGLVPSIPFG